MTKNLIVSDNCHYAEISQKQFKRILYLLNQIHNRGNIDSLLIQLNPQE